MASRIKIKNSIVFVFALVLSQVAISSPSRLDPLTDAEDNRDIHAPALAAAVQSQFDSVRARVAQVFGRILDSAGLPFLYTLAQDLKTEVRTRAIFSMGQFGWQPFFTNGHGAEIIAALVPILSDADPILRMRAVEALGKVGLAQTPELIKASLSDQDSRVRAEALMALARSHYVLSNQRGKVNVPVPLPDDVTNIVLGLAHDPTGYVRRNVANVYTTILDPRAQATLIQLASDSELPVRFFALKALAKQADPTGAAPALRSLTDANLVLRVGALQTLTTLKAIGQISESSMRRLSHDPAFQVRDALATGLTDNSIPTTRSFLLQLHGDHSPTVRGSALRSLGVVLKDGAESLIKDGLKDSSWPVRVAAVDAAQSLTTDMEAVLQSAAADPQVLVRDEALAALATVQTPTAFATIQHALASDELSERSNGIFGLEVRSEPTIPSLYYSTYQNSLNDPKWVSLRQEIATDLAAIPGDQTTIYLQTIAADPDYLTASTAQTELAARGVTGLPALPAKALTYSPYREKPFVRDPIIVFETSKGRIEMICHTREAPITTASIAGFANDGKYNGLPWHRVVSNFVIQGGDPDKTGYGDAGWELREEINPIRFDRGAVGIARSTDFDSGGVQIFINSVPTPSLDGQYTVFAHVIAGMDVVDHIEMGDLILRAYVR